ncbi:MAG: hypothetical protein IIV45_12025 [Lachnospiraceae bacterium]|nr:hypothetical protein [Lachnospiraceae bacterium]
MVYIFAALYKEAEAVIQAFGLKKVCENSKFQEFVSEEKGISLVITGVGSISAAVAVGCMCTKYGVKEEDFLVNIGTCASSEAVGSIFFCNKITDENTGRTFYPDILFKHPFMECEVYTYGKIVSGGLLEQKQETSVYDMEAAAIYQAGAYFFSPHQMSFLKIVSDNGQGDMVTPKQMEAVLDKASPSLIKYIEGLREIALQEKAQRKDFSDEEKELIQKVCEDLHCSKTMELSLYQHFRYLMLTGVDVENEIKKWYEDEKLPCKDRREGKKRFEELKAGLF